MEDKWCILNNEEVRPWLSKYFNEKNDNPCNWNFNSYNSYYFLNEKGVWFEHCVPTGYTVITLEQFKKDILKIEDEIEEPLAKDEDYSYLIPIMKELNII